ncbi:hypothetical protein [Sulfitobacter mediterraneus]|uniref:Uncharacterized protein n=1 Tax=Sulfitobacter mediterraneus TaxID=83219 RepID=A0A2T6C0S7_9RHOB|nr:hypothetical protein [Sulfitobacter mediterraneus]KIN75685.1 hypothetical protein Z950_2556 [Sulfitobacter mediterraneus KCTC 32188]PTX61902.1 hypothetical protein C8N31_12023 [Sulfitobacter mediterraneus]
MSTQIALQKEYDEIYQLAEKRLILKQKLKKTKIHERQIEEQLLDIKARIRKMSHFFMLDERGEVDITLQWILRGKA